MPNFNPLHRHFRNGLPSLHEGAGATARLPIDGVTSFDQLARLVEAGKDIGHWTIERDPIGIFHCKLTAEGAEFLSQEPPP